MALTLRGELPGEVVFPRSRQQDEPRGRREHLDDGGFATTGSFFATMKTETCYRRSGPSRPAPNSRSEPGSRTPQPLPAALVDRPDQARGLQGAALQPERQVNGPHSPVLTNRG